MAHTLRYTTCRPKEVIAGGGDAENIFYRIDSSRLFCRTIDKRRADIHIDCKERFGDDARKHEIETFFIDFYDIDMAYGSVVHRRKLLRIA